MIFYTIPYVLIPFLLMLALHIVALVFRDPIGKIIAYVNIGLHIAFVFLLILGKVTLEESVLLFMISVSVYLFAGAFSARRRPSEGGEEAGAVAEPAQDAEMTEVPHDL